MWQTERMNRFMLVLCLTCSGCSIGAIRPEPAPKPIPTTAPTTTPTDLDDCQRAEIRLKELDCRRADGSPRWLTPKGSSFTEYCRVAVDDGRSPRPDCIAQVTNCEQVNAAQSRPEGTPCDF
jgi:hypothetical protein